ncbi:cardiolipin synthase [Inconstantimicrobium mannanitabidum]|uniref:Cardiolipin synthase n=1 Tax=Inconstantimicrobium mannanitabidum TaxID=1604901 RepID=A0ACB5RG76_9CLOT|nr:cardiolipin synthase [Clostridium sp. TW13]GKX68087.1 cardiolipin synthase [Clostridium sp. TW13]
MTVVIIIFFITFIINLILGITIVILERQQPAKTIAWLLILLTLPPIGLILYIFLGRNWKISRLKDSSNTEAINTLVDSVIQNFPDKQYTPLIALLANNSHSPIFVNNEITIFKDGIEKFAVLKKELLKAKHHIHLEYYIFRDDSLGNEIKDILIKKSLEGVKVRFIIDKVGSSKLKRRTINELKNAGIELIIYTYILAPLVKWINTQINYRDHRKLVVIDGRIGFIGGINIGDEYIGKSKLGYWRDTHIMVKGDFVLGLQDAFFNDFKNIQKANTGLNFYEKDYLSYFPPSITAEKNYMQLVKSGPNSEFPSIMHGMIKMISMATKYVYISTPYFIPSESIMDALVLASLSGVEIKIIFPEKADHFLVNRASRSYLAELLRCGAKVYFYDSKNFIHSKTLTVDGMLATLGTANMDRRSFELNYELNAVIYDKKTTQKLDMLFIEDLKKCREFTLKEYENQNFFKKFIDSFARIFSALL